MEKKIRCDVCELQAAIFYCEADEAYLCDGCDSAVHGANTLASRHKRVKVHDENEEENEDDRTCPADYFQDTRNIGRISPEYPPNGLRIGDIKFARVSQDGKDQDESHQVPHFVPVAQELPSLEPFRFHALAASAASGDPNDASPPRFNGKFMSLLESDPVFEHEEVASPVENLELGVVPELVHSEKHPVTTEVSVKGIKGDKDREARVNRYRQKRQTRMFSKKIRYEVRKIYAENRPRLKGRFVRRNTEVET